MFLYNPFVVCIVICAIYAGYLFLRDKTYKKSAYYNITHLPYGVMRRDAGRYGEYLSYLALKNFEKNGAKFLLTYIFRRKTEKQQKLTC